VRNSKLPVASALGQLGVQRAPFGAALATLEAEAQLQAAPAAVARLAVDGHVAGVHVLVAQLGRTAVHHLEVVVAGQAGDAVRARDAHLVLGLAVVGLELLEGHRPVEQVGSLDLAVHRLRAELVLLEAQRRAGPVRGGAPHGLADPGGQPGKVLGHAPAARRGACVSQASWLNDFHSSLMKLALLWAPPASSTTTLMPFWHNSLASVPPPAPDPMMTTTESSFCANVAMCLVSG